MKFKVRDKSGKEFNVEEIEDVKTKAKDDTLYRGFKIYKVDGDWEVESRDGEMWNYDGRLTLQQVKSKLDKGIDKNIWDSNGLSSEEIASLKQLAAVADKLVGLVNTSTDDDDEDEEEEIEDEEEEQIEEVIDTAKKKTADSIKKSATAIEKKIKTDDSLDTDAVSDAWAKRYGGNK